MSSRKRLDSAVAALQRQYGKAALQRGMTTPPIPPQISTGFSALDTLTGCRGIPLRAITILSGRMTSGKLTLAYKALAQAQGKQGKETVALLDLNGSSDPDYLARCGVQLDQLFLVRPTTETAVMQLLIDLVATQQLRLVVVDSLPDLLAYARGRRQWTDMIEQLVTVLRQHSSALIVLDEFAPIWVRWFRPQTHNVLTQQAALHITLKRERWLHRDAQITGYEAQATILKSRWAQTGRTALIAITFNGTVRAQTTW